MVNVIFTPMTRILSGLVKVGKVLSGPGKNCARMGHKCRKSPEKSLRVIETQLSMVNAP